MASASIFVQMATPGKKFVHTSFRIPLEVRKELEDEAERIDTNLNALVNHVLTKYITFDRMAEHVGTIVLQKLLFSMILDQVTVEEMEKIGEELGPIVVNKAFNFFNITHDLDNLIGKYFQLMGSFSGWYRFSSKGGGSNRRLIFEHEYGRNWSVFLKHFVAGAFKSVTGTEPKIRVEDGQVIIQL